MEALASGFLVALEMLWIALTFRLGDYLCLLVCLVAPPCFLSFCLLVDSYSMGIGLVDFLPLSEVLFSVVFSLLSGVLLGVLRQQAAWSCFCFQTWG